MKPVYQPPFPFATQWPAVQSTLSFGALMTVAVQTLGRPLCSLKYSLPIVVAGSTPCAVHTLECSGDFVLAAGPPPGADGAVPGAEVGVPGGWDGTATGAEAGTVAAFAFAFAAAISAGVQKASTWADDSVTIAPTTLTGVRAGFADRTGLAGVQGAAIAADAVSPHVSVAVSTASSVFFLPGTDAPCDRGSCGACRATTILESAASGPLATP